MAKYPDYQSLNEKQKKLALAKWHERQDAKQSPEDRKAAARKAFLAEEVAPGLTRGDMLKSTASATRMKYGEAESALGESLQQNKFQAQRQAGWFDQYKRAIAEAGQRQAAQTQAAVAGVQNLQTGLDATSAKSWAGEQQAMSADAANRGATTDPTLASQAHNASNVRNALTGSFGAMLVNTGNAQQQNLSDRKVTSVQQKGEALAQRGREASDLRKQRVRLKREKGDFKVTYADSLKAQASKSQLEQALTLSQLREAGADIAQTKANTKKTQAETRKTALEIAYFQRYGKYPSTGAQELDPLEQYRLQYAKTHGGRFPGTESSAKDEKDKDSASGPGSLTPATEQKRISQVRTVSSLFRNGVVIKDNTGAVLRRIKGGDVQGIRKYLLTEKALDPLAVQIGLALYRNNGKLGRGGVQAAHRYGIHVGGNFGIAKPGKKAKKKPDTGGSAGGAVGGQLG